MFFLKHLSYVYLTEGLFQALGLESPFSTWKTSNKATFGRNGNKKPLKNGLINNRPVYEKSANYKTV